MVKIPFISKLLKSKTNSVFDFENNASSYSIRIGASNGSGITVEKVIELNLWDVIEVPENGYKLSGIGYNSRGQLGDGSLSHRSSPVETLAKDVAFVSEGPMSWHSLIVKVDGSLWVTGRNLNGELGTGKKYPTKIFNGYEKWVSYLYKGVDSNSLFF